jgi:hypothetical protein
MMLHGFLRAPDVVPSLSKGRVRAISREDLNILPGVLSWPKSPPFGP